MSSHSLDRSQGTISPASAGSLLELPVASPEPEHLPESGPPDLSFDRLGPVRVSEEEVAGWLPPQSLQKLCMLGKVFYYAFLVCQLVHFEYLDLLESRGSGSALTAVEMPTAWEHRYVRVSSSAGQQCALLRKSAQNGMWLA